MPIGSEPKRNVLTASFAQVFLLKPHLGPGGLGGLGRTLRVGWKWGAGLSWGFRV